MIGFVRNNFVLVMIIGLIGIIMLNSFRAMRHNRYSVEDMRNYVPVPQLPLYTGVRGTVNGDQTISFEMAYRQSDGFFTDILDTDWMLIREKVEKRVNHCTDKANNCPENPNTELFNPKAWYGILYLVACDAKFDVYILAHDAYYF